MPSALSPPTRNPSAHEASPPRGHTLRHRRRPRFESTPGTNRRFTRIHRSSLTPHHHHRQPSSTEVSPNSESINRRIEISSVTIRRNHREEDFAGTVTVNLVELRSPTTAELNVATTSRGPEPASTELTEPPPPGDKTKKPQIALHRARVFTPEPEPPWTTFFQSSGKAEEGGDNNKAKIEDF
ncbi:hypothetical protein HID58_075911 [Brassica napus]|uniref:Uncharacterized protein n=1 Tax=Brassica napus TaxID=3708 RepID=A0ABQ7YM91_BRANA|nr:hypothetical protein HID58_075911 [Brassica napus]